MLKRFLDFIISFLAIIFLLPIFSFFIFVIFFYDFHSPFYIAPRVGRNGKLFKMIKLRSMRVDADKTGVSSTANDDDRVTPIGKIIRKFKLDELSQLINVLNGSMSLVGPRPQVESDVKFYTKKEMRLLDVRPGITDFSSIVFSDEGKILEGSINPDKDYNDLIRPWKSRLGLFYTKNQSILVDFKLLVLTIASFINKNLALKAIRNILRKKNADKKLVYICYRDKKLTPAKPPA